ncbi:ATP-grasp domain-containing protein [Rudaeicoccus suwonensis]|uniref:Carbamoyl-phosphate synthase large subunit n=1 Tax=Rudaeicoccus suwonensis TaxID=657409 RepID=A0A561E8P5_9MICO|nr:ATP-grasp domain-containing protein [Rudaeicoccus suwonensis]TWE11976.1 carbamoyl-phosphate synthase large subunit [Rudaeicoccus suwonensis]
MAVDAQGNLGTVLVTGAGGAAAVTVLRSLTGSATLVAADIDPVAVGLYLVPRERRALLPRGDDDEFIDALLAVAIQQCADLVIPTVDSELRKVSAARDRFAAAGIDILVESVATLDMCLDKFALMQACSAASVRVPATVLLEKGMAPDALEPLGAPFIIKPRSGAGGRGFEILRDATELKRVPHDGTMLAQALLPGDEYSIDVLAHPDGGVIAAVPRRRDKVDSGIAVAGRTVADDALEDFGRQVADVIGARGVVNVQAKLDNSGTPALLEVNSRFPGTMALTQAAGIDMPLLAVRAARGENLPRHMHFKEVAVVRYWEDIVVPIDEYAQIGRGRT